MTILIGMDEAGYGPNLGPLVISSSVWHVDEGRSGVDLWKSLGQGVQQSGKRQGDRLVIDDSKRVHCGKYGARTLEEGVLVCLDLVDGGSTRSRGFPIQFSQLCSSLDVHLDDDYRRLPWSSSEAPLLPVQGDVCRMRRQVATLRRALDAAKVRLLGIQSRVIFAGRFNALLSAEDSKGALLSRASIGLLRASLLRFNAGDAVAVADKHGGRSYYQNLLQEAFPEFLVLRRHEGRERSQYQVRHGNGLLRVCFQKAADREHLPTALASMVSKYLRELLMGQFNRYWMERVDGLRPTAGYPSDARRFWKAIRPLALELGIPESAIWRER